MKIYSFVRECITRPAIATNGILSVKPPKLSQFVYFIFAPTLIYRDEYPKTKSIEWIKGCGYLLKAGICSFISFFIINRYCQSFSKSGIEPYNIEEVIDLLGRGFLVAIVIIWSAYYGLVHCYLNTLAAFTRFADRQFYKDW